MQKGQFKRKTYKEVLGTPSVRAKTGSGKKKSKKLSKVSSPKKKSVSKLHKLVWEECKRIIRARYEHKCYTCGVANLSGSNLHTGHSLSKGSLSLRFKYDIRGLRPQCLTSKSNILMADGNYKNISMLVVGDEISSFREKDFTKTSGIIKNIETFLSETLYRIDLENGDYFEATGDHMIVVDGKWKRIDEMLHTASTYDILEI